jgi:protocatechuate 3,4-dioxygenase alpha subunit
VSGITPSQTVGPFFDFGLEFDGSEIVAGDLAAGRHIIIEGSVRDGAGDPVGDAVVEVWQANASGRYRHPRDEGEAPLDPACGGFGRCATSPDGRFAFRTVQPGPTPGPDGTRQAPHLLVSVLARGILTRLATRIYFEHEPANAADRILAVVPADRRGTLIAREFEPHRYVFDIVLQGPGETVFFDL